jgi:hypothetical protein
MVEIGMYFGAFLKLHNIMTTDGVTEVHCPIHGFVNVQSHEYCPQCGNKTVKITVGIPKRKNWVGEHEEFLDQMCSVELGLKLDPGEEPYIVLIPNHQDKGGIELNHPIFELENIDINYYKEKLGHGYNDYINWLVDTQKFKITTHFGFIRYWS